MTKSSGTILAGECRPEGRGAGTATRNRRVFRALPAVLAVFATTVCLAAPPQYALIDLGSINAAGAGLFWKLRQGALAPSNWPSTAGVCQNGTSSWVWATYGNVAVGGTCAPAPKGATDDAAKWTISGQTVTLTDYGVLPAPDTAMAGGSATFQGFNTVGDFVGSGAYTYGGTSAPCPCFASHGFIYNNGQWTDLTPIAGYEYDSNAEAVNDSHEVVGQTTTISSTGDQALLKRAFVYIDGTTYNLTFYVVGGPKAFLQDAYWIDCQGNIAAVGLPNSPGSNATLHNYLLVRQGPARTNCPK